MITKTYKNYPAKIGMMSLVGCMSTNYPLSFGNYFSLSNGPYIVNMWAENFKEICARQSISEVECCVFSDGKTELAFICDDRIPMSWTNTKLCVTGHGWGSRELCEACCEYANINVWDHICGCEQLSQSPRISKMYTFKPNSIENHCMRCHRKWKVL